MIMSSNTCYVYTKDAGQSNSTSSRYQSDQSGLAAQVHSELVQQREGSGRSRFSITELSEGKLLCLPENHY